MRRSLVRLPRNLYHRAGAARAAREDGRFRTRIRAEAGAPALVLSPHFDDAVLDCWSLLSSEAEVSVVTVFAGIPAPGRLTLWDAITGAEESSQRARERVAEDAVALARAGRAPVNLPFLDAQYRPPPPPSLKELDLAVSERVPRASRVYVPAGIGSHPDHLLTRRYGRMLNRAGVPLTLYADLPYCVLHGWPGWVDGREPDAHRNVDAFWRSFLADVPELSDLRAAEVIRLDAASAAAKLAAMRSYETQYPALSYGARGLLDDPAVHGFEVRWKLPAAGERGAA